MKFLSFFRGNSLRSRSMRGSVLTVLNLGSENLLRLAGNLVLTRLLFPEAFGIMALVQMVMTGLKMFSDIGVRLSIIQHERGNDPLFLDTAWILQIGRGFLLWLATWALAAPVAAFYEAPILADLLPVTGLTALLQGFYSTKLATANRELMLGRVTAINLFARVVGMVVLIALAFWWHSVWALVIGGLIEPFLVMVMSHIFLAGHPNRFRIDRSAAGDLVRFGRYIFLSTITTFLVLQADRAILGKLISLSDLAFYNIAIMLATLPRMFQQQLIERVLYSLYSSRPPGDSEQNYRNIARARLLVIGASFLAVAILAVTGNSLIILLYDPRYATAGPLLVLMAVASLPGLISSSYPTMILTKGDSGRFALLVTISAVLQITVLLVAVPHYGVVGAAISPLISSLLLYPILLWFIAPYKGWIPRQDLGFGLAAIMIAALAIWINLDSLRLALASATPG